MSDRYAELAPSLDLLAYLADQPSHTPVHDQLVVDLAVARVPEVLEAIRRDQAVLDWSETWARERDYARRKARQR
jgi:hypothetical protein